MRGWVPVFLVAVLAGCADEAMPAAPATLAPLPPPRSDLRPADLTGLEADAAFAPPGPWAAECTRQWSSGAYAFTDPPVVEGLPCRFLATSSGVLHYASLGPQPRVTAGRTVTSQPIPNGEGYFDWVSLLPGGVLVYLGNGTSEPVEITTVETTGRRWPRVDAVRLADGTVHATFVAYDRLVENVNPGGSVLVHAWWQDPGAAAVEQLVLNEGPGELELATDGRFAVLGGGVGTAAVLVATDGAFSIHPFPGFNIFDVDIRDGHVVACASGPPGFALLEADLGAEVLPPLWTVDPIQASRLSVLERACPVVLGAAGPTVFLESPGLAAGELNPIPGIHAVTRTAQGWVRSAVGLEADGYGTAVRPGGVPIHIVNGVNGTSNLDWRNGTEVRAPTLADPTGPWHRVWGNFGDSVRPLLDDERLYVVAEGWWNPPFRYYGSGRARDDALTWAVMDVPVAHAVEPLERDGAPIAGSVR